MMFTGFIIYDTSINKFRVFRSKMSITVEYTKDIINNKWNILLKEINIAYSGDTLDTILFTKLPEVLLEKWNAHAAQGTPTPRDKESRVWRETLRSAFLEDTKL